MVEDNFSAAAVRRRRRRRAIGQTARHLNFKSTINCEFDEKKGLDASDVTGYKTAKEKKSFRSPLSRKER